MIRAKGIRSNYSLVLFSLAAVGVMMKLLFTIPVELAGGYLRSSHIINERMALAKSMVVNGNMILSPGLSMMMSPGKRPSGSLLSHGHNKPARVITIPR
jgi:hypothetical protein